MLLDRIDIDVHGPLHRVELGPFSEGLNVVCGPEGSGKTAIARFVRDSLIDREYPVGMMSSSTGRIVWADGNGIVHCRREQDGSPHGRTKIEFERRGDESLGFGPLKHSWINGINESTDRARATAAIQFPESIVDGVITDTGVTNVARVVTACLISGLDSAETYQRLPIGPEPTTTTVNRRDHLTYTASREHLRSDLADVEAEIGRLESQSLDYRSLMNRRDELNARLSGWRYTYPTDPTRYVAGQQAAQQRLTELCELTRELRSRQSVLRRSLSGDQRDAAAAPAPLWSYTTSNTAELYDEHLAARRGHGSHSQRDELHRINRQLDAYLAEAAELRRSLRSSDTPYRTESNHRSSSADRWTDRDATMAELRRVDQRLASLSRLDWLRTRREQLASELNAVVRPTSYGSPLSAAASGWLVRLSGGRLRQVDWPRQRITSPSGRTHGNRNLAASVRIDGRAELDCPATDRALAVLAIRMAAGELMAATGKRIPLLLETHRELLLDPDRSDAQTPNAYDQHGLFGRHNHAIAAAICDYANAGRQVIVLTSHESLASQVTRAGGRMFRVHAEPVVHAHRPIWRPHYRPEKYVGPHPHTYGRFQAPDARLSRPIGDINRDFDTAWREAYGLHDSPDSPQAFSKRSAAETGHHDLHGEYRDGYYTADNYTTVSSHPEGQSFGAYELPRNSTSEPPAASVPSSRAGGVAAVGSETSPFFLTVDSPIDQAPSIDAVAAARLRGLSVTHVNHLMQQDSNRLSDALGLASVNAATIRRWQAECRLVCRVPQLRGFDARVLVGCGITDPAQLAATHPSDLLQEVEAFLATDRGRDILLSGSSQELSRITSWIAAGNSSPAERAAVSARANRDDFHPRSRGAESLYVFDSDRYEEEARRRRGDSKRRRSTDRNSADQSTKARRRKERKRASETNRAVAPRRERSAHAQDGPRRTRRSKSEERANHSHDRNVVQYKPDAAESTVTADPVDWRFYLQRSSAVVDAPSIGARMAERLETIGIETVNDLLESDPESVASELGHRRVDHDVVVQWQQQAEFVCRVPMLRGHDSQLLVMVDVTTPEELSECDAEELFALIDPVSRSKSGQRILRGGKLPDLEEVSQWIQYAQHTRELMAA